MKLEKIQTIPQGIDLQVIPIERQTNAERQAAYRQREGNRYRAKDANRKRVTRAHHIPRFIGVDSEGIGRGKRHRAVLLGVGSVQHVARDRTRGLVWDEVFEFLYAQFEANPEDTVYVGFYLKYDFNEWLRSLPMNAARSLLTPGGKEARRVKEGDRAHFRRPFYPVRVDNWEMDILGFKALSIRPRVCRCLENQDKCEHDQKSWMTICDAGPFFQTSFLKVLEEWTDIRTEREYRKVKKGKEKRATARLSKEMMEYNALENELLGRVMVSVAEGLRDMGLKLRRDQWYGPGAVASAWLTKNGAQKNRDLVQIKGISAFLDIYRKSYFGGWFEIFSHGIIKGETYNYDINSAYPYATTKLPHICNKCQTKKGKGRPSSRTGHVLLYCTVQTKGTRIGALPHRTRTGNIIRPNITKGWYWQFEVEAARRANLVKEIEYHEWVELVPCSHPLPYSNVAALYEERRKVGKDTPKGKAIKLVINSIYGKFAQSIGSAPFNNWLYASYITAHCRSQILDAIASHPGKANATLMVATDGIIFDSPHPTLSISKSLGEWDQTTYHDLVMFKPGVYWSHEGKTELKIKSRGVSQRQFAEGIELVEGMFQVALDKKAHPGSRFTEQWLEDNIITEDEGARDYLGPYGWPQFEVHLPFHMTSCPMALARNKWYLAGEIREDMPLLQSSDPGNKRNRDVKWNTKKARLDSTILVFPPRTPYESKFYKDASIEYPKGKALGFSIDGDPTDVILEAVSIARDRLPGYDIDLGDIEWITVWDGGPVT